MANVSMMRMALISFLASFNLIAGSAYAYDDDMMQCAISNDTPVRSAACNRVTNHMWLKALAVAYAN